MHRVNGVEVKEVDPIDKIIGKETDDFDSMRDVFTRSLEEATNREELNKVQEMIAATVAKCKFMFRI